MRTCSWKFVSVYSMIRIDLEELADGLNDVAEHLWLEVNV